MKLLVVDGMNLMFQMYYGMPNKFTNKDGKYIHGVIGFVGALIKIIDLIVPTHMVVVFDGEHQNERLVINEEYKGNRIDYSLVPEEDNPFFQLDFIYQCLNHMNIKNFEANDFEADDVIARYALKYGEENEVVIASFDSDFFQLINNNVKILRYRGKESILIDSVVLYEKYNITPNKYSFFKSLVGDTADNVKGLTKIGLKTASKVVNLFDSIEDMYGNIDKVNNLKIIDILLKEKEKLLNNFQIINLTLKANLVYDINELSLEKKTFKTMQILQELGIK